jgi:hypothetical protein
MSKYAPKQPVKQLVRSIPAYGRAASLTARSSSREKDFATDGLEVLQDGARSGRVGDEDVDLGQ